MTTAKTQSAHESEQAQPVVVRMPADLHKALKAKAEREERSMAQTIRYALRQYVQAT
ncbi:MAG: ribbon-helix-helix protein, CopG family [Acidimicrobiales bacterium]